MDSNRDSNTVQLLAIGAEVLQVILAHGETAGESAESSFQIGRKYACEILAEAGHILPESVSDGLRFATTPVELNEAADRLAEFARQAEIEAGINRK